MTSYNMGNFDNILLIVVFLSPIKIRKEYRYMYSLNFIVQDNQNESLSTRISVRSDQ